MNSPESHPFSRTLPQTTVFSERRQRSLLAAVTPTSARKHHQKGFSQKPFLF
jgi:hypothetical protein